MIELLVLFGILAITWGAFIAFVLVNIYDTLNKPTCSCFTVTEGGNAAAGATDSASASNSEDSEEEEEEEEKEEGEEKKKEKETPEVVAAPIDTKDD